MRALLRGVVLADAPNPTSLIAGVFDPATLLGRIHRLFVNLAASDIENRPRRRPHRVREGRHRQQWSGCVSIDDRFELIKGDVCLWLENDLR